MKCFICLLLLLTACSLVSQPSDDWLSTQLVDIRTGQAFTIDQFDTPILVESFAVWCPTCTRQQIELQALHEKRDDFVSISLNTDPNEDINLVNEHIDAHEFTGYYAIAPINMTQLLIEQFGIDFVNAPQVPVVLICPDRSMRQLQKFVKGESVLVEAIESCKT